MVSQDSHETPSNSHVNGLLRPEAEGPSQMLSRPSWARWVPRATPQATAPGRGQERSHLHTASQALGGRLDSPKRPPSPTRAPSCLGRAAVGSTGIGVHAPGLSLRYPPGTKVPHAHPPPLALRREPGPQRCRRHVAKAPGTHSAGLAPLRVRTVTRGGQGPGGSATRVRRPGAGPDPWPPPPPRPFSRPPGPAVRNRTQETRGPAALDTKL